MGKKNWIVLAAFLGLMAMTFFGAIALDIFVDLKWGSDDTISWSVALALRHHIFFVVMFAFNLGGLIYGLMVHFFKFQQPNPEDFRDAQRP